MKVDRIRELIWYSNMYLCTLLKNAERINRGSETGLKFGTIVADHKMKQLQHFVSEAHNKTNIIQFLVR